MSKKLLMVLGLFVLMCSSLFAATAINLSSDHIITALQTTDTVVPTLKWTIVDDDPIGYFIAFISKSPALTNSVEIATSNGAVRNVNLLTAEVILDYDTTYYWQVRQYDGEDNELIVNGSIVRSDIESFTTPKMSVIPYLTWEEVGTPGNNYTITLSETDPFTDPITVAVGSENLYRRIPNAQALKYNTTYYWKVSRTGGESDVFSFTTKPLNIIQEIYQYSSTAGNADNTYSTLSQFADIASGANNRIRYIALTDEFENITVGGPFSVNADFIYSSTISNPVLTGKLFYLAPGIDINLGLSAEDHQTIMHRNIDIRPATGTPLTYDTIGITNNEVLSLKFQYGNVMKLNTPTPAYVDVTAITSFTNIDYATDPFTHQVNADNLYFNFATGALTANHNSIKVNIKNKNTGTIISRYAYRDDMGENRYRFAVSKAELNAITTLGKADRISIYSDLQPDETKDFIWLGNAPNESITAGLFSPTSIAINESANFTHTQNINRLVRFTSTLDPVGFVIQGQSITGITIGAVTDPMTKVIEATVNAASVKAVVLSTGADLAIPTNLTVTERPALSDFNMLTPANFTTNADVYPRLSWTNPFVARGEQQIVHYFVQISNNPDFTDVGLGNVLYDYYTTENFLYPEIDLDFNKSYFWKVSAYDGNAYITPANITNNNAWVFTTTLETTYQVVGTIPENRTFVTGRTYKLVNNPAIAAGKTLTIQPNVTLKFNVGATFTINGNIVTDGSGAVITFTSDAASWQGLEFAGSNRDPLVVNEANGYVSGSLLDNVLIEKAIKPVSYAASADFDVYITKSEFKNNANGIDISEGSFVVGTNANRVTIETFTSAGSAESFAIKGGKYFDFVEITGDITPVPDPIAFFTGTGIITTNKNAKIKNSIIKNLNGNAIVINSSATDGAPLIHNNTITGTGVNSASIAVKAIQGATITENKIGNIGNAADTNRNTGFAIINGAYIAGNKIEQNGNGAILADPGATVINNEIKANIGYAIKNGLVINNNTIVNETVEALADFRITNAIEAVEAATVSNNIITGCDGYAIKNGKTILNNQISFNSGHNNAITGTVDTHYAIKASAEQNAKIEGNTITSPIGYAILNGTTIKNNDITGNLTLTKAGAFGIKAEVGATVSNNKVHDMQGTSIENGLLIHNNDIKNGFAGIKADPLATITNNTLVKDIDEGRDGFAIYGGKIINFNSINEFYTPEPAPGRSYSRQEVLIHDLIFSENLEEFRNNTLIENIANGGSILNAVKANTQTTPLAFTDNIFTDNKYNINQIRLSSKNMSILDNSIENNFDDTDETTIANTGGLLSIYEIENGQGTALYIKLQDTGLSVMKRNLIKGHKGAVNGAALYIDAFDRDYSITITDQNIITENHAIGENAKGAAVYHHAGIVTLGAVTADPQVILGNTITLNSVNTTFDGDDNPEDPAGSAIHTVNSFITGYTGKMSIYRNIISANAGNWAIFGAPLHIQYNNIYDNTFDGEEEVWDVDNPGVHNPGRNFYYTHNATHNNTTYNFWGNRSDLGQIDPSIYDDNESDELGMVVYQPILSGPSEGTPGIVNNIEEIKVTLTGAEADMFGLVNLPTDTEIFATITAKDNNEHSSDFTEVTVRNLTTGYFIQPLLQETGPSSEVYKAGFTLTSTDPYDPQNNKLPVTGGDIIVITSVINPTKTISLMASETGNTAITPYIKEYNFGPWAQNITNNPTKKFTFTNVGNIDLTLRNIVITGANALRFSVLQAPAFDSNIANPTTILIPSGSFDVIVAYDPDGVDANHVAALEITFDEDLGLHDRTINLSGRSLDDDIWQADPWGPAAVLTQQMYVVANVSIEGDDTDVNIGDRIGAFVIKGMKEELRGNAPILDNSGLANITIQTAVTGEEIYFKLWNATNETLYDCDYRVVSNPGATITARNSVPIEAMTFVNLQGTVQDAETVPAPIPGVLIQNVISGAPLNPNTNLPFKYTTDSAGEYFMQVRTNSNVILHAIESKYVFSTEGVIAVGADADGVALGLQPAPIELEPNDATYIYPTGTTNPINTGFVNEALNTLVNHYIGLDFTGTIQKFEHIIAGQLTHGTLPLGGIEIDVTLDPLTAGNFTTVKTDPDGNFYFVVESIIEEGVEITITVPAAKIVTALSNAGYTDVTIGGDIVIGPFNLEGPDDLDVIFTPELLIDLETDVVVTREHEIILTPGWNLVSFNIDFANRAPSAVFNNAGITQVRNASQTFLAGSQVSDLTSIIPGQGYYAYNNTVGNITLTKSGTVINEGLTIPLNNGWNITGYPMSLDAQPRFMFKNNANILQASNTNETYLYNDLPVGASTLRELKKGEAYWIKTDASIPTFTYQSNYENYIKKFEFKFANNAPLSYSTDAFGVIDNKNSGTFDNPKEITVTFANGITITALKPTIQRNTLDGFTLGLTKYFTTTDYDNMILEYNNEGYDAMLAWIANPVNGTICTFAGDLLEGPVNAALDFSHDGGGPNYLVFSSQNLSDEPNRQRAQLIFYEISRVMTPANSTKDLTAFGIQIGAIFYPGSLILDDNADPLLRVHQYNILVPEATDLDQNATLHFAHNGFGLYSDYGTTNPNLLISGTATHNFNTTNPVSFWVDDILETNDNDGAANQAANTQEYAIRVIKGDIPARASAPAPMFAQNSSRSSSPANFTSRQSKQTEDNRNNPFGEVTVLPNSHLVISRISNNGAPVDTSYVIAAFVGDELRGKNKVKRVEGQTYALVLINTITENETVSFKIWKPGSNVLTFDNTLATIPGGTTGSLTSMYQFNMQYTDTDDIIAPQFINELHPAYPNPFNPTTTIKFSLKDNQRASVAVYNIKGQRVTTLVDDMLEKGYHEIVWNSTNAQGKSIGSGIYFIRMTTDNYRKVQKVVLIK